jgi:hypothetical protein
MTITHAIMLFGIVVAAVVALIVGHLQRKQMRQIELYKQDPSVGLVPPPSALRRFVQSKWDTVLGFGAPLIGLALEFASAAPLTRASVFLISLSVALLLANVVMLVVFRLAERTASLVSELRGAHERHLEMTSRLASAVDSLAPEPVHADGT